MRSRTLTARRNHRALAWRKMRFCGNGMRRSVQMTKEIKAKEADYGQKALEYVEKTELKSRQNLPTIKPGTAEWDAWERYFVNYLGFQPWMMGHVEWHHREGRTDKAMTVPTQWPEWFDTSYSSEAA